GEVGPRRQYTGETEIADQNGRRLGYAALSTLEGMLPPRTRLEYAGVVESGAPLAIWKTAGRPASGVLGARRAEIELPVKDMPSAAELEAALKACDDRVQAERLRRKLRVRRIVGEGRSAKVPLWAWRVGDGYFVGQPNEAYTLLQTELRRAFPKSAVTVLNLVNGSIGYLARAELHDQDIYQVWQSPFDRGCLERVVAGAASTLRELGAE
ncbi:MAG: alkaline ceramidase, partial [Planctomycetes bacterium]|nr:alkaline ceramidase [Planctomycetota bacterium]